MIDLSPEAIAAIMIGGVLLLVLTGYPLGLVIGSLSLIMGYFVFGTAVVEVIYARIYGIMTDYIILAAPLFIFMGGMLERAGITEKLYEVLYLWLGGLRGGLAIVTVLIGTILAACVGIIAASITMLTLVALPSMMKRGYSKSLATGSICAGGCLGILIPPSIMLVLYGPMAGISVGRLFFGAFVPGFILSGLYCTYIAVRSYLQPEIAPSVPAAERRVPLTKKLSMLAVALVPPVILVFSVLGVIFVGIAPPTEAAGIGALVATFLTVAYRRFNFTVLKDVALLTLRSCGFIFLIVTMAVAFSAVFLGAGAGDVVKNVVLAAPGGHWGIFAIIMFIVFILGMFMDWLPIIFIIVPIVTPIAAEAGFNPLWFGIMVCVNLQMCFMTPPFAGGIFICRGACDPAWGVTMGDIIRGVIPFVILIMVGITLCAVFPELITWLPQQMIK